MGNDSSNVAVANPYTDGCGYIGTADSKVPTDAISAIPPDFENLGYFSEEGVVESEPIESSEIKAYGGDVVHTTETRGGHTVKFKCIETNPTVLKARYGEENVQIDLESGAFKVSHNGKRIPVLPYIFEFALSETLIKRTVVPRGKVTGTEDLTHDGKNPLGYGFTITALPYDDEGNTSQDYFAEVVK